MTLISAPDLISVTLMNSLQLSADLGASDVLHHFISLHVQVCEIIPELVDGDFPGGLLLVLLEEASGMAAWSKRETETSQIFTPEGCYWRRIKTEEVWCCRK